MSKPIVAFTVRLPPAVAERVDAFAHELEERHPGVNIGRGDAVRTLLLRALDGFKAGSR